MELNFKSLAEDRVGAIWQTVFDHGWPGWKAWFEKGTHQEPIPVEKCRRMLRRFMPGIERSWDAWVETVGGDDEVARFLSFWSPPRYLVNCSQIAGSDHDGPYLIRNYDLDPRLNEGTILMTGWHGHRVIGMVEGMAGLSDGMNNAGLALSLTFGGRIERGPGFGIPLIMRYVLESCRDAQDALAAFRDIPCHMSYNVTAIDRNGRVENLMLSPDRPVIRREDRWATNHQLGIEWPFHGRLSQTLRRGEHLEKISQDPMVSGVDLADQFITPPLLTRGYDEGFGTVFTAFYRPSRGKVELMWSDGARHDFCFDDFQSRRLTVQYGPHGSTARYTHSSERVHDKAQRLTAFEDRNRREAVDRWTSLNPLPSLAETGTDP